MAEALRMDEETYAEEPALEWLQGFGWEHVYGPEIAPNGEAPERPGWYEVLLEDRLRAALVDLNPAVRRKAIEEAILRVRDIASPEPIRDHLDFHELLVEGVPVTVLDDGEERAVRVRLVDFEQPGRNEFLAVNQFRIVIGQKNRRPDILLFVNGLPLGQLEVKDPGSAVATPVGAANQVAHYVETIPRLYRFVELVAVSDLLQARLGTISTPPEHIAQWKTMDPAESEGRTQLDVLIEGVFEPARFLDLVRNFVLFEESGAKLSKVVAKYHQVDAVRRAVEATADAMAADGRAGVVWHTQGSGKSYTMVFYARKLRSDPRFENPTIVALTDRTDLDTQLHETFARERTLAPAVEQAESIADLRERLDRPAGGIVFSTIQKFAAPEGEMPVLSTRRNVIVMADEAHRTQYDRLAANVTVALPHATRIGFTGTPIEKGDRSTQVVFGDLISVYRMERAVADGATVPIYYESRRITLDVKDEELLREVEEALTGEEDEAAAKTVRAWTRLERIVGTRERLERVADDVAEHFQRGAAQEGGKAMVVAMSQRIAAELTELLRERLGEDAVTCVISASATDDPAVSTWRRSASERKQVEADFKDPDHALRVVVVRDMWLTGFDVPSLYTIYVDKPMRDHGLLQAIARVNRVFRDKPGGLVVDYIGIGDDLKASLAAYSAKDVEDAAIPLGVAIARLREKHEVVAEFFHGVDFRGRSALSASERANQFAHAVAAVIAEEETKKRFLKEYGLFRRLFRLLRANTAAEIADGEEYFRKVAGAVTKIAPPVGQVSPEAEQAVRQFVSDGLAAGEVIDVLELAGDERPEISILSDEFLDRVTMGLAEPVVVVALLKRILSDEIRVRRRSNQMQAKLFSDRLRDVLQRYEARQITSGEVIERLVELAKKMRDARRRNEALGLTVEETAFYDAVAGSADNWTVDPKLAEIARALVTGIKEDLTVDWADHEATEAAIRAKIKRLLRRLGYMAPTGGGGRMPDRVVDDILEQARVLYRWWPELAEGELLF